MSHGIKQVNMPYVMIPAFHPNAQPLPVTSEAQMGLPHSLQTRRKKLMKVWNRLRWSKYFACVNLATSLGPAAKGLRQNNRRPSLSSQNTTFKHLPVFSHPV